MKIFALVLGTAVSFVGLSSPTIAQEEVRFQASEIQPTAFKIRKAKAKGITLQPTPGIELRGYSYEPEQAGPHPAVIILVSGDGLSAAHMNWAESLSEAGYVALVVDSYGARGGTNHMDVHNVNMPDDAYSAFRYLAARPDVVDANRISLLGFSVGGSHLFTVVGEGNKRIPEGFKPEAAVAVYPTCPVEGAVTAPMLVLAGAADKQMSLGICQSFVQQTQSSPNPVELHVYPGATHFFDNPAYAKGQNVAADATKPMWFKDNHYNAEAHSDAVARVLDFLLDTNL